MSPGKGKIVANKSTTATDNSRFSADEMAAMKERARELKAAEKGAADREEGLRDALAKLADMPEPDRSMGQRIHELITETFPDLAPKTYYGMPAYAKDGKTIAWFKGKSKFKVRYATLEFGVDAKLDDGKMWPVSFALLELTPQVEARIVELVRTAVS
jgi:uncharacterized protein YdhG (YjbR/CyaY superfamily)